MQSTTPLTTAKMDDEQVASIICHAASLVTEDARPILIAHMYEMAYEYNENGSSAMFAHQAEKLLKKIMAK